MTLQRSRSGVLSVSPCHVSSPRRINVDIETVVVTARPPAVVSSYAADPLNTPEWYENIESVEWKTSPQLQVGSQVEFVARFLGRTLRYTYEIVELVPGDRMVMRTQQGPFPMETTYTWLGESEASTRMTLRNRGEPSGADPTAVHRHAHRREARPRKSDGRTSIAHPFAHSRINTDHYGTAPAWIRNMS